MEILGVIPARGGSRTIPKKNIVQLAGQPLLSYTCKAALSSQHLTRTILATDDPEIAEVGRTCGVDVPFLRPAELAKDETPMVAVLQHVIEWCHEHESYHPDVLVLLQPTSPLRRSKHIDDAVDLLLQCDADTVVSVVAVPHQFNPISVMRLDVDGRLVPFLDGPIVLRRQDKPRVYARNGPAVFVVRREVIQSGTLYGDVVRPFHMKLSESIDIDDESDLVQAEFWLSRQETAS